MIKVFITLPDNSWHSYNTESFWAEAEGEFYKVQNIPFYTKDISFDDLIKVIKKGDDIYFNGLAKSSGNSTYRLFKMTNEIDKFDFYLNLIVQIGCSFERATENLYAINVPKNIDVYQVYKILQLGENRNVWEFEEGKFAHKIKELTN